MFKQIRGSVLGKGILSNQEISELIAKNLYGTVSMNGPDGYPKAVPMLLIYDGEFFYFHCVRAGGEQVESLRANPKVCISIFEEATDVGTVPISAHKSIVAYGKVEELSGDDRIEPLKKMSYAAGMDFKAEMGYINKLIDLTAVFRMKPDHLTSRVVNFNGQDGVI